MPISKPIHLIGYGCSLGSPNPGNAEAAVTLQQSPLLQALGTKDIDLLWDKILIPDKTPHASKLALVSNLCQKLAEKTKTFIQKKNFFMVLGGDHTSAIGTWSGVSHGLKDQGPLGLIWVDAHMDSHTPHTSLSGNLHGMPLASLLGFGMPSLTNILNTEPKLRFDKICLIGVRSFERGEAALLKELNVRIYFMEEVRQRGLKNVMQEALRIVTTGTAGFGISIDVDSLDPVDAPGTGVREPHGLLAKDFCKALEIVAEHPHLLGAEIVEFDPCADVDHKTEKLIANMIGIFALGKRYYEIFKNCCTHAEAVVA